VIAVDTCIFPNFIQISGCWPRVYNQFEPYINYVDPGVIVCEALDNLLANNIEDKNLTVIGAYA
jgi:hypothetical protein